MRGFVQKRYDASFSMVKLVLDLIFLQKYIVVILFFKG